MSAPLALRIAIDRTRHTEALFDGRVRSDRVALHFVAAKPITRAFRRMARELEFDACEMALATAAMAAAQDRPFRMLPAPLLREVPHRTLVCRRDTALDDPARLAGSSIAVRAYTQTTVVWLRGILRHEYGVDTDSVTWLTQEDSHVAGFPVQANERRIDPGLELHDLLARRMAKAAITLHLGGHPDICTVLADPVQAARTWEERLGMQPVNHLLAVRTALLEAHPWLGRELVRLLEAARRAGTPDGSDPMPWNRAGAALLLRYAWEQGLTPRLYAPEDVFAYTAGEVLADRSAALS